MKADFRQLLAKLPRPANKKWTEGVPFVEALAHGTMTVELFAPVGEDHQTPHEQDELYVILQGTGNLEIADKIFTFDSGDALFVPARAEHKFVDFSDDFACWAIFW
jgi:mannose-6-phosphate isomerase-like protein (cupin superfamily)